jgi:hypothetical protein
MFQIRSATVDPPAAELMLVLGQERARGTKIAAKRSSITSISVICCVCVGRSSGISPHSLRRATLPTTTSTASASVGDAVAGGAAAGGAEAGGGGAATAGGHTRGLAQRARGAARLRLGTLGRGSGEVPW